ncbi:MAG: CPBP family intramembrane metalloprotease [Planctomycetota bacterium]|nr:CPBP family intramembrane metalloprotease [Planctomycetota bacterium]
MPFLEPWLVVHVVLAVASVAIVLRRRLWDPKGWRGVAWPFDAAESVVMVLGLMIAPAIGMGLVDAALPRATDAAAAPTHPHADELRIVGAFAVQLLAVGIVWAWRARRRGAAAGGAGATSQRLATLPAVIMGVVGLVLAWPLVQVLGAVAAAVQQLLTESMPPAIGHDTLEQMISAPFDGWLVLSGFLAIVLAPLAEECAWRGACQQAIRKLGVPASGALCITAAFFSLTHLPVLASGAEASGLVGLLALGVALGVLAERSGGILAPFVAHALFNAANLALAYVQAQLAMPAS